MPKRADIKKTLVIGSGPIVIGQAAEFDYAGTQACRALREEGVSVVLVNSNPATIMTDAAIAERVYIEPLNLQTLEKIIESERPDSLLPTLGGQTGLNLAMELYEAGILAKYGVKLLGTNRDAIFKAEDREAFKATMLELNEPIPASTIATDADEAAKFANSIGYPVVVRPAYTLGGTGGGFADDETELRAILVDGFRESRAHQCLIEKSIAGWKEIEFEVLRDPAGNSIVVCDMENIDPVGVHTGDSIVVAPTKTLEKRPLDMLRDSAKRIIEALKIEGGCNVQFALHPETDEYAVIEVNPRLSRSSALASKATAYPIARVATKIALGYCLDEIRFGDMEEGASAAFEPNVTYTVIKIPRWPFDKFTLADRRLGTRMKATGEVMAIGDSFTQAFLKALRSLELPVTRLVIPAYATLSDDELVERLKRPEDDHIFSLLAALSRFDLARVGQLTKIAPFFLSELKKLVDTESEIESGGASALSAERLWEIKAAGVSDAAIASLTGQSESGIRALRKKLGVLPTFRVVDTCPASPGGVSEYFYSVYDKTDLCRGRPCVCPDEGHTQGMADAQSRASTKPAPTDDRRGNTPKTAVVLGSGPIRIGQGVEFDYCCVHCTWALRDAGYHTVIINNNPETVSTDFDTAHRLYFEPLTREETLNVLEIENPECVSAQFGGQTAIKLAKAVEDAGYKLLGTDLAGIDAAEDRERFDALLERENIPRPAGKTVFTTPEALEAAEALGYPVLVRPSYVLGGQGMVIAYDSSDVEEYMALISRQKQEHPILVDKYVVGKELEIDAVCDGAEILIPGVMEHIERAGVHSGDSISMYPAQSLTGRQKQRLIDYTRRLALALNVKGLINIQYILSGDDIYVIEVNPRSSRTVPFMAKVTGVPLVELAARAALGESLAGMGCGTGLCRDSGVVAVKAPVFSFEKLPGLEVSLGPEMKSTGEVMGVAKTLSGALLKGLVSAGIRLPKSGAGVLMTVSDSDKQELCPIAEDLSALGFALFATKGTAYVLNQNFVATSLVARDEQGDSAMQKLEGGEIGLVVCTPTHGRERVRFGFRLRRMAVERAVPVVTSLDTARALVIGLKRLGQSAPNPPVALQDI